MIQFLKKLLPVTVISSLAAVIQCANPVDKPPLRWETKIEVPISNKDFNLKKELNNIFSFNKDSMAFIDPSEKDSGDTMIFQIERFSSDTFETHEDSMETQKHVFIFGPIPISRAANFQKSATMAAAAGQISITLTVKLDSIYSVTFYDTSTNRIPVVITNTSSTSLSNLIVNAGTLGKDTIASIAPNRSDTAWLPVKGRSCNGSIPLILSGTKGGGQGILSVSMNLNELTASSIKANDHIIRFSKEIAHHYEITDTVDIDYIDIADGFFSYSMINHTGIPLNMIADHDHLWMTSYCTRQNFIKSEDLVGISHADSLSFYSGELTGRQEINGVSERSKISVLPHTEQLLEKSNISNNRLFPNWDSTIQKSVTPVKYLVSTPTPKGDTLILSSSDSLTFSITSPSFKFKEFLGTSMEEYHRDGDTQKVFIGVPWPRSSQDSLRGRFILSNVFGDVFVKPNMDSNAYINTMAVKFTVFSPESISVKDSSKVLLTDVRTDSTFQRNINLTNVTNLFPDTLYITAHLLIPKGTRMKVVNDLKAPDPDYSKYIGRMKTILNTKVFFNAVLDWEVLDTVRMDLGSAKFKVPQELRYIHKLENRQATFRMRIKNQSNLNMFLFALLAPKKRINALDSIDGNELTYLINNPDSAEARGFVSFIDGVFIPLRDSSIIGTVKFTNKELEIISTSDTCSWRWQLRFVPKSRDALKDVDFLRINSSLRIEGINNMDSLIIW